MINDSTPAAPFSGFLSVRTPKTFRKGSNRKIWVLLWCANQPDVDTPSGFVFTSVVLLRSRAALLGCKSTPDKQFAAKRSDPHGGMASGPTVRAVLDVIRVCGRKR